MAQRVVIVISVVQVVEPHSYVPRAAEQVLHPVTADQEVRQLLALVLSRKMGVQAVQASPIARATVVVVLVAPTEMDKQAAAIAPPTDPELVAVDRMVVRLAAPRRARRAAMAATISQEQAVA